MTLDEIFEKKAIEAWEKEFTIACVYCKAGPGELHNQGCQILSVNADRHKIRPDLFAEDGQAIAEVITR